MRDNATILAEIAANQEIQKRTPHFSAAGEEARENYTRLVCELRGWTREEFELSGRKGGLKGQKSRK